MQEQLTIRIPKDLDQEISRLAQRLQINRSAVVRMAIQQFVRDYSDTSARPYERVKHLIGTVQSGITDLGSQHRKHLIQRLKSATRSA